MWRKAWAHAWAGESNHAGSPGAVPEVELKSSITRNRKRDDFPSWGDGRPGRRRSAEIRGGRRGRAEFFLKKYFAERDFARAFWRANSACGARLKSRRLPNIFRAQVPDFYKELFYPSRKLARFAIVRSLQVRTFCKFVRIVSLPGSQIAEEFF